MMATAVRHGGSGAKTSTPASPQSPNAIPPRTSSTRCTTTATTTATTPNSTTNSTKSILAPPARSVLRPVPESDWLAQRTRHMNHQPSTSSSIPSSSTSASPSPAPGPKLSLQQPPGPLSSPPPIQPRSSSTYASSSLSPSAPQLNSSKSKNKNKDTMDEANNRPPASPSSSSPGFQDPERYATEDFDYAARQTWTSEKEEAILGPYSYLSEQPGKDVRTSLINAFNAWLRVPEAALGVIARVVAMLHTASLLVDDVEDGSRLRRGRPVAHGIFGTAQTINSANYVYFCALRELRRLANPAAAVAVFSDELANLHRGQGMDLYWRDTLRCPTEDQYLEMVGNKTGGLFRLAIKLMQAESPVIAAAAAASAAASTGAEAGGEAEPPMNCVPLVNTLGIIFQIQDDYRNLASAEYGANKGYCEDLTEGKFSFPIVHAVWARPDDARLLNILRQKPTDVEVKRYAVDYMRGAGSFRYTEDVLDILIRRARKAVDELEAAASSRAGPGDGDAQNQNGSGSGAAARIHLILDKLAVTPLAEESGAQKGVNGTNGKNE